MDNSTVEQGFIFNMNSLYALSIIGLKRATCVEGAQLTAVRITHGAFLLLVSRL